MNMFEVTTPKGKKFSFEADAFSSYDGVLTFSRYNLDKQHNEEFFSMNKEEWSTVDTIS